MNSTDRITQLGSPFSRQQFDIDLIFEATLQPNKLIFNIPIHGFDFTLSNAAAHAVGAPTSDHGLMTTYLEITKFLAAHPSATKVYEDRTPYVYADTNWITFEDETSVHFKCKYTALNNYNAGLQLISQDLHTTDQVPKSLTVACRQALDSCLLDRNCL